MVDEAVTEDLGDGIQVEAKPREGGMSGKKLVLFIVLPVLLILGAAAGAYFGGLLGPLLGVAEGQEDDAAAPATATVFYDLPEMLVNLDNGGRKPAYLKISVSLELEDPAALELVDHVLPRIVDSFQIYLRELRIEDLKGSAGLQRLREELLLRVNTAVQPTVIRDVLFKEMLVQ